MGKGNEMKLLLTSAGLKNKSIFDALIEMVGKPANKISVAFVPTAANYERGDKSWLIDDLVNLKERNFKSIDIVDISGLQKEDWIEAFSTADVLFFGGGNTFHLMYWVEKSGLKKILPSLLKTKVYVGISAGSCIAGPTIYNSVQNLFDEKYKLKIENGLRLVNFQIIPHLNSPYFSKIREGYLREASVDLNEPIYAIDDDSAIKVVGDNVSIVSEGKHIEINI